MYTRARNRISILFLAATLLAGIAALPAHSATLDPIKLTQDLNTLVLQGDDLVATMTKISLTPVTMSTYASVGGDGCNGATVPGPPGCR